MFEIITLESSKYWDKIVTSFVNYDVYYLSGYSKGFHLHGDGEPMLVYYKGDQIRGICVMMKRDIANSKHFNGYVESNTWFDLITPYGYGGFIFEGSTNSEFAAMFNQAFRKRLVKDNIVSVFLRYHPQIYTADTFQVVPEIIDCGKTIEMDLESEELIWKNISPKNRTAIRKAIKNGVTIKHDKNLSLFDTFIEIYNLTMDNDNADNYYYFSSNFYKSIHNDLYDNYEMFYAEYDSKIIAMSLIIFANKRMHYHLSGGLFEYRSLSPTNYLLYEAALWGHRKGFKTFHLGGGIGSNEDTLYKFKSTFNRSSDLRFSIGKRIIIPEKYYELVELRKKVDEDFDVSSSYFPLYRA